MKKTKKALLRLISMLLCVLLLSGMLVACGKDKTEDPSQEGTIATDDVQLSNTEEAEKGAYRPEQVDMGGYAMRMISSADQARWFVYQEDLVGNSLNVALYNRQLFLEDYFNIDISIENLTQSELLSRFDKCFSSNEDFADILFMSSRNVLTKTATKGAAIQLQNKEGLNLEASYWDQRIQSQLSINGRLYLLEGDFSVYDELRTDGILYNRAMYENLKHDEKYGNLSTIVEAGDWTFEMLKSMVKEATHDVNGDGLDKEDTIGMFTNIYAPYCYFLGSGKKILETQNGRMTFRLEEDYATITEILENTVAFFSDADNVVITSPAFFGVSTSEKAFLEANKMLLNGKNYMQGCTLVDAMNLTEMQEDFGLLPIPKYTKDQDGYHCWLGDGNALMIPATAQGNLDKIIPFAEGFCYFSRYMDGSVQSFYDAFFDNLSITSLCRTEADYRMMELIFASKTYDLDRACSITGINDIAAQMNPGTLHSDIASKRDSANTALNTFLTSVMENDPE